MNKNKLFGGLLVLILSVSFAITNFIGPNNYRKVIIDGDGSGLYAYLPALIVYRSVDFTKVFEFETSRRAPDYMGHYFHEHGEILINKFTSGTALLQLPFFLFAYILSFIFGLEIDGYNILFQYAVAFAALFWSFVGLVFFVRFALCYKIKKEWAWIAAIIGFIGTNLFSYTLLAPAASHVYSFSLISMFLYFMKNNFMKYNRKYLFITAFLLALIILIRPVNMMIVMAIPFLSGSLENFKILIKKKLQTGDIFITVLIFIIGLSPQLVINFLQTGNLIVYSYTNEGFYFTKPELWNFLFSFRKGWFIYTPLMLLLIPAIFAWYKRSKFEFFSFLSFFSILIYLFSSWWNWFYGDSFGMRPMIDYYCLFFLLIAFFVSSIRKRWAWIIIAVFTGFAISLNLIQTIQYAKGIIHPDSMNKEAYMEIFLKTSERYAGIIAAGDESFYGQLDDAPFFITQNDLEKAYSNWTDPGKTDSISYSGLLASKLDNTIIYSPSYTYEIPAILNHSSNLYVIFDAMILQHEANAADNALFIIDISDKEGNTLFYKKFKVKKMPDKSIGQWQKEQIGFKLPEITDKMEKIKFYIWNLSGKEFLLDDVSIRMYAYN